MAIYSVKWNQSNEKVFISGSADKTIKIWSIIKKEPLYSFEFSSAIIDIAWAPFSSSGICLTKCLSQLK